MAILENILTGLFELASCLLSTIDTEITVALKSSRNQARFNACCWTLNDILFRSGTNAICWNENVPIM